MNGERPPIPWLPLVQELTATSPDWGIWKNADSALAGHGDIDAVAAPGDRETLIGVFRAWAVDHGFTPAFTCNHIPGVVLIVGLRDRGDLVELDLCERQVFRGSPLFDAADLRPMLRMDARGFRRLREGAEGLLLLFLSGTGYGGRPHHRALHRKGIVELLRTDPQGVEAAASLFGKTSESAVRLARAVTEGSWDRGAAMKVQAWSTLRALRDPRLLGTRLTFRLVRDRRCALWPILLGGRTIPGDVDAWLARMRGSHEQIVGT